ncbi:psbP domain-containing protein 7, chloroplastic [Selaginella moellendorffii]|nr:psbP domain-containing protein 7, chloroplastic [Selaginella moellendorffii]|eukprot:XP_002993089.2 psbP domain-containing protein 7, chloroplastic [Selaginella moellendorffii]
MASISTPLSYPFPCGQGTKTKYNGRRIFLTRANLEDAEGRVLQQDLEAAQAALAPRFSRRFTIGILSAAGLGIGANFLGTTSFVLGLNPEVARSLRLDVLYPVRGFFRCFDTDKGFEFIYPQDWFGDQKILYRSIEKAEKERPLDLPALKEQRSPAKVLVEPVTAFGPPGTDGEVNVSVIVAPILPSFSLEQLGDAREAAKLILDKFIAPPGSKKTATLVDASTRRDEKAVYYTLDYCVEAPTFFRHNVAVYTSLKGKLFSLNVQTPQAQWSHQREEFIQIANSFKVI